MVTSTALTQPTIRIRRTDMPESCDEIKKLRKRFEKHMDEHRLDDKEYSIQMAAMLKAIDDLTKAVQPLVDGVTVLVVLQKLVKWASGFAFLGIIISWYTGYNPFK